MLDATLMGHALCASSDPCKVMSARCANPPASTVLWAGRRSDVGCVLRGRHAARYYYCGVTYQDGEYSCRAEVALFALSALCRLAEKQHNISASPYR